MARVTRALGWSGLMVGVQLLLVPTLAMAQAAESRSGDRVAAQDAYRHAVELFDARRYAEALAEFKRAYALSPAFRIQYNIGLSQAALGDALGAVEAFSTYLREGGTKVDSSRRAQVDAEIARLSKQLAWLTLDVEEPAAEVMLDGNALAKGLATRDLRLNAGRHTVTVRSADGTVKTQSVVLAAGAEQRLRFEAHATEAAAGAQSSSSEPPAPAGPRRDVPWLAWGVTGALGVSTAITGVVALRAHDDEEELQARRGVDRADLLNARDKVKNYALATDVLLACSVVATGVSLYLTLKPPSAEQPATALVVGPGQLGLRGRF